MQSNNAANVAIVDFDHGIGGYDASFDPYIWHYMLEDEEGNYVGNYSGTHLPNNAVYDNQIYQATNPGEVTFAFISTCASADYYNSMGELNGDYYGSITQGPLPDGTIRGMPYAFTHRLVGSDISADGYHNPDSGSQVYLGFPIGSPSLTQWIPNVTVSGWYYCQWVEEFFIISVLIMKL